MPWQESAVVGDCQIFECGLHTESFRDFAELVIAQVRFFEITFDSDNSFWSWHLQLEVRVMRYRHELCIRWSSQHSMILRLPVDYLELKTFSPKVKRLAEDNH